MISIEHKKTNLNWLSPDDLGEVKTLVLGSFNPSNLLDSKNNLDYYYGRKSNLFWKTIAALDNLPDDYYFSNINRTESLKRKKKRMINSFACLDIINELQLTGVDQAIEKYKQENIFGSGYDDSYLWRKNSSRNREEKKWEVKIERIINSDVIDVLNSNINIKNVIGTFGIATLEATTASNIISTIRNSCKREINWDLRPLSPSGYNDNAQMRSLLIEYYSEYLR